MQHDVGVPVSARTASRLPAGAAGVADEAFRMRVRALVRSRPVTELAVAAQRGDRLPDVDAAGLALAAVDLVVSRQGLPDPVTYDECLDMLARLSAIGDPQHPPAGHRALAAHVLDGLLNKTGHQAKFGFPVGNWTEQPEAGYSRSVLEFWLLREKEDRASGQLVLHADADAINALVAGLAFDVADEQAAAELILRRQIARGEFGKAEATAQRNLQLTVQYAEELDAVLVETRRDIRAAAPRWETDVPRTLDTARSHLAERLAEEDVLLEHLRSVIDGPAQPPEEGVDHAAVLAAAARAARLLERCRERHVELMSRVLGAIDVFLDAQQAQAFRPLGSLRTPELGQEVLRPLLMLPPRRAEAVGAAFLTALSVSPDRMVRLADLLDAMLAPVRAEPGERVDPDPDGDGEEMSTALPPELVATARDTVLAVGLPARLSVLLDAAGRSDPPVRRPEGVEGPRVAALLAAAALWLYAPDTSQDAGGAAAHELFGPGAMAGADGTPLPPGLVGGPWWGDDLLVAASEDQLLDALSPGGVPAGPGEDR
jgi:hypothetical protein